MTTPETTASDTVRLEPCPFPLCGGEAQIIMTDDCGAYIECTNCGLETGVAHEELSSEENARNITRLWNTRPLSLPKGEEVELAECPIGLFWHGDTLCLKTEYGNNEGRIDAYIVKSGEFYWGDAPQTIASQRQQMVAPIDTDFVLATLSTKAPAQGDVERVTRAMYEEWPMRAVSHGLAELAGVPLNEPISWEKSLEMGVDHSGLRRHARAALASMSPALSPKDEGEAVNNTAWLDEVFERNREHLAKVPRPILEAKFAHIVDDVAEDDDTATCEGCGKAILRGQFIHCYDEGVEVHVDCNNPNTFSDDPQAAILVGDPMRRVTLSRPSPTSEVVEKVKEALGELEATHDYHLGDNPGHRFPIPHEIRREYKAGVAKVIALLESVSTEGEKAQGDEERWAAAMAAAHGYRWFGPEDEEKAGLKASQDGFREKAAKMLAALSTGVEKGSGE